MPIGPFVAGHSIIANHIASVRFSFLRVEPHMSITLRQLQSISYTNWIARGPGQTYS